MDLVFDPTNWRAIKILIGIAVTITAIGVIGHGVIKALGFSRKVVHFADKLDIIISELTPNGGHSVKDLAQRAADDSAADLELSRAMRDESHRERVELDAHIEKLRVETNEHIDALKNEELAWKDDLESRLARFISHEARGSLAKSKLLAEAEAILKRKADERAKAGLPPLDPLGRDKKNSPA
jgi:hypothetical protein